MYNYKEYDTVHVDNKRIYVISDELLLPSITTILGQSAPEEKTNSLAAWKDRVGNSKASQILKDATDRGTNVHLMIERFLRDEEVKEDEFPDAHAALYKSLRFSLRQINKVEGLEVVLYSEALQVAGRCDLVGSFNGIDSIIDYKTSTRDKSEEEIKDYFLQTCFYALAHNEMFGTDIQNLVIIMGIENRLPKVFRKTIDDELVYELCERVSKFYSKI